MGIRTLATADFTDPKEALAWLMTCPPGLASSGAALLLPPPVMGEWSAHYVDNGVIIDPSRIRVRYVPPAEGASVWSGAAGYWEPIPDDELADFQADVTDRLRAAGWPVIGDALTLAEAAEARADDALAIAEAAEARAAAAEARVAELEAQLANTTPPTEKEDSGD